MPDDNPKHTVADLIKQLQFLDPDAEVWTDGCDCYGQWNGVINPNDVEGYVLIGRKT